MNPILIKKILSSVCSISGAFKLLEHHCLKNKAFVLMYHRVIKQKECEWPYVQPGMFVSDLSFDKHIHFLKSRFKVIYFEELVDKIISGENTDRLCAITLDDGWLDNYTYAYPILKKYNIPATIFLATGFLNTSRIFWPEEISFYLDRNIIKEFQCNSAPPPFDRYIDDIRRYVQCKHEIFMDQCIELLKRYSLVERENVLKHFRGMFKAELIPRQIMNWDEVREMQSSGLVRFGAHTVNHEMLDQLSFQKARDEITKSLADIEYHLGDRVNIFAYPNGNFNESIQKILTENAFKAAVTTRKGFLTRGMSLMEIPRIAIHEDVSSTIPMFRSRILLPRF